MSYTLTRTWSDDEMQRKALWVAAMMDQSKASAGRLAISTEAVVAQAAEESGWGACVVGQHNLFGIKATPDWTGARVLIRTREVIDGQSVMINDWFRDYPDFAASIDDHLNFLEANANYRLAGVFAGKGDAAYFQALKLAGYATDPNYAANLLAVRDTIRTYFLPYMKNGDAPAATVQRRTLMIGCEGADVIALQRALGFMDPKDLDGWFGQATRSAVITFQRSHPPLAADGIVGDSTRQALHLS